MPRRPRSRSGPIKAWRPADRPDLELRRGEAVTEPYPRHWHEEMQLCLATGGGGTLDYRGCGHVTARASLFIVHPGEVHANATDENGCSFRSMYVPVPTVRRIASEVADRPRELPFFPRAVIHDPDLVRLFLELHRTLEAPGARLAAGTQLVELFAGLIARYAPPAPARPPGRERAVVRRVRDHLTDAFAENISLEELAGIANLSPYQLNRVFSNEVGMPPHAYQISVRILRAKHLIRDGHSLAHVAAATGFVDQSHLSRHFKWLVKLTPGAYSKAIRAPFRHASEATSVVMV